MSRLESIIIGLVTSEKLCELTGITSGRLTHSGDITWLSFIKDDGKKILVADRNIRRSVSWDNINDVGCVNGKNVVIGQDIYKCRLITGASANPSTTGGGEWDELIVAHTPENSKSNWQDVYSWCIETVKDADGNKRFLRGNISVETFASALQSNPADIFGWRPVLEFVGTKPPLPLDENANSMDSLNKLEEINSNLKKQHNLLSTYLRNKGVEVSSDAKMSSLISKVGDIPLGKRWAQGSFGDQQGEEGKGTTQRIIRTNLSFVPSRILINTSMIGMQNYVVERCTIDSNLNNTSSKYLYFSGGSYNQGGVYIDNIKSEEFTLNLVNNWGGNHRTRIGSGTWYAYE